MKTLHVIPSLVVAGAERIVTELALNAKNTEAEVLCLYAAKNTLFETRLHEAKVPLHFLDKKPGLSPRMIKKIQRVFKEVKPDVVHTHLPIDKYTYWGVKREKIAGYIHTVHTLAEKDITFVDKPVYRYLYRNKLLLPVGISKTVSDSVSKLYSLPLDSVTFVCNGIDINRFALPKVPHSGIRFIQVGRLTAEKNQEAAIRAFAKVVNEIQDSELWLVGAGPNENMLKSLVNSLDLEKRVLFFGNVPDVDQKLAQCDIFLMPSRWEGFGLTLIEAMAAGLPAIISDLPAFHELVKKDENALFHAPEDVDQLTQAMLRLANDKELCHKIGEKNKLKAKTYNVENMVRGYEAIYTKVISR